MHSLANAMAFYDSDTLSMGDGRLLEKVQLTRHSHLLMRANVRVRFRRELELLLGDAPHYHPELSHDTPLPFLRWLLRCPSPHLRPRRKDTRGASEESPFAVLALASTTALAEARTTALAAAGVLVSATTTSTTSTTTRAVLRSVSHESPSLSML